MISCILLSAGLSRRFGSPKALATLTDTTVIEHIQKILIESQISEIVVVLGSHISEIKPIIYTHRKIKYVYNENYPLGQTSSFKVGLENISNNTSGVMLLPIDYPLIKLETINCLINHFMVHHPSILVPTYHNQKGHPPIFNSQLKKLFLDMDNNIGLNLVMKQGKLSTDLLPVNDKGVLLTFNTLEEFVALKKTY